jgi:hypothetical protein
LGGNFEVVNFDGKSKIVAIEGDEFKVYSIDKSPTETSFNLEFTYNKTASYFAIVDHFLALSPNGYALEIYDLKSHELLISLPTTNKISEILNLGYTLQNKGLKIIYASKSD